MKTLDDLRRGKLPNAQSVIKYLTTVLVLFFVQLFSTSIPFAVMFPVMFPPSDLSGFLSFTWVIWSMGFPFLFIGLLICPWVMKDAKEQGMPRFLWVFVCLFLSVIGLGIYLVFRIPWVKRHTYYGPV